jgi:uncharacterized protein YqfB (UPF0267 family)
MATAEMRAIHMVQYSVKKAHWEADENIKEACKIFLLSRFKPVYLQALSDSITEIKNVTVKELIEYISNKYPPAQEEINAVEATLRDQWDRTNHIENLFVSISKARYGNLITYESNHQKRMLQSIYKICLYCYQ